MVGFLYDQSAEDVFAYIDNAYRHKYIKYIKYQKINRYVKDAEKKYPQYDFKIEIKKGNIINVKVQNYRKSEKGALEQSLFTKTVLIIFIILFVVAFITGIVFAFIPIYLGGLLFVLLWRQFLFHDLTWKKSMEFGLWSWLYFIL